MSTYCQYCGSVVPDHRRNDRDGCPTCMAAYRADVEAGKVPAGLDPRGYKFDLWLYIRSLERDVVAGRKTEADARAEVARSVENAKRNYERTVQREAWEKAAREEQEKERQGPTGFLI